MDATPDFATHTVRRRAGRPGPAAHERRAALAAWLRKKWGRDPRAGALADRLDACARGPCGSGGCPVCGEALQRDFAAALDEFVGARRRGASVVCVSVALPGLAVPRGGLTGLNLPAAKRRVQARLGRAGVGWAIGAWDYSLNEHETGRYPPFWLPHLHLVSATDDAAALRRRLRDNFARSDAVPRPVRVQAWDGRENALLYLLKAKFDRRIGVDGAERFSPKAGEWRLCRATSQQRLRSAERRELLLHLDQAGPAGRLFMRKARPRRTRGGLAIVAAP